MAHVTTMVGLNELSIEIETSRSAVDIDRVHARARLIRHVLLLSGNMNTCMQHMVAMGACACVWV